ncbi:hypothetical protein [Sodalis sp. RH20]|uniref:hypothetical protein n=1 Tax=unclassified Sodalis (in: enterobacteria) TaxID=2636512 RepID=UPI0039B644A8
MTNNKLMKARIWGEREFEKGSIPDTRTIKRWVEDGLLRGKIVDSSVWIFSSERWGVDSHVSHQVKLLIKE